MRSLFITLILLTLMIPLVQGAGVNVTASVNPSKITPGQSTNVTIKLTGASEKKEQIVPLDVMLVMDCSGSMYRYGDVIEGPYNVHLTTSWQKIGEFTLNRTSNGEIEIMLQTLPGRGLGADWYYYYYDVVEVYLKNKDEGWTSTVRYGYSVVRFSNFPPGTYEVYAKLYTYNRYYTQPDRVFAVELPPVRIDAAKQAAKTFVDMLKDNDRVGLVRFWKNEANLMKGLTRNKNSVKWKIDRLEPDGGTPMGEGLKKAINYLINYGRSNAVKVIILFTDGWWNEGCSPIDQAKRAKANGIIIYTIGWGGVNENELKQIANITGGKYYYASTSEDLERIYKELAVKLSNITAENVQVKFNLSNDVEYDGNATREPTVEGNTLIWNITTLSANETWEVKFSVKPRISGTETIYVNTNDSKVTYKWGGENKEVPINVLKVDVINPYIYAEANKSVINETETVKITVEIAQNKVKIVPRALNKGSHGEFTAFIFDTNVNTSSVYLTYTNSSGVTVTLHPIRVSICNWKTIAKFERDDLNPYLDGNEATFVVYWKDSEGNEHHGSDTVNVVNGNGRGHNNGNGNRGSDNGNVNEINYNVNWTSSVELNQNNTEYLYFTFDNESMTGELIWTPSYDFVQNGSRNITFYFNVTKDDVILNNTSVTITANNVNRPPNISITADKSNVSVNETVNFTVTVSDEDNDTVNVTIDYGDGNTSSITVNNTIHQQSLMFNHTYSTNGTYTVKVSAYDGYDTNSSSVNITVVNIAVNEGGWSGGGSSGSISPTSPTPSLSLNVNLTGRGPFVGDKIYVYVINKTACDEGKVDLTRLRGGVKILANVSDVNESNCDLYNITVLINGKRILYNDTLKGLTEPPYYITTEFVPLTAGKYHVTAEICNSTSCPPSSSTYVTVYIRPVKQV